MLQFDVTAAGSVTWQVTTFKELEKAAKEEAKGRSSEAGATYEGWGWSGNRDG